MKKIQLMFLVLCVISTNLYSQYEFLDRTFHNINFSDQQTEIDAPFENIDEAMLDSIIVNTMQTGHIPGLQALIVKQNEIVWSNNYGYANIALNRPVEDSTLFFLASVTKTIVATAIMQLWEDGLFDLDDNINDYLLPDFEVINPYFPNDTITIRMLMVHSSSINDNWDQVLYPLVVCGDSPIPLDSFFVNYFTPGGIYNYAANFNGFAPGSNYDYSNVGSCILAYIIEKLSGVTFEQYCDSLIFEPLEMPKCSWFLEGLDTTTIATPYWRGSNEPTCHSGWPLYPIGWLRINKIELEHFLSAYMNWGQYKGETILDSTTIDLMLTDHLGFLTPHNQGLIWYQSAYLNGRWPWGHEGAWAGNRTAMFYQQDENWGIICFINTFSHYIWFNHILNKLCDYAQLYGHIYAIRTEVNKPYMIPSIDTTTVTSKFVNVEEHDFTANAIYVNSDSSLIDSIALYDDGLHGDSLANDGIWGGFIIPISQEEIFKIGISSLDFETGEYFFTGDLTRFTTAGPIVIDSLSITYQPVPKLYLVKPFPKNQGQFFTVEDVQIGMSSNDSSITHISGPVSIASIAPGAIVAPTGNFSVRVDSNFSGVFRLNFEIKSEGWLFWKDSISVVTSVEDGWTLPISYKLFQNYPNPFNPITKIRYQIPELSFVTLKVFDVLGCEITTLVNEEKSAGNYEIDFNASTLSSGVYFYKLHAGDFAEIKKMILLK